MKILLLVLAMFVLSDCAHLSSMSKDKNLNKNIVLQASPEVKTTQVEITVGNFTPLSVEESAKIEENKRKDKKKLENIPDSFKKVDFKNFKYPAYHWSINIIPLKDGGYEYDYPHSGGEIYGLDAVYYADLTGDTEKEAIVNLSVFSCGGSCDGGSDIFYVYAIKQNKLKLLWHFQTGSLAYGGGLKSFHVKNKKIVVEEFGRCSSEEEKVNFLCTNKYAGKNVIRLTFGFNRKKIIQESKETIAAPVSNVMNYRAEIIINE